MKKEYPPVATLRKQFSGEKIIPQQYELPILKALSHFPELRNVTVEFRLKNKHPVPHGTMPVLERLLVPGRKRKYVVTLLENAPVPMDAALFKNLPEEAQLGALAHELGHVLRFHKTSIVSLWRTALGYDSPARVRELERAADVIAIEHGLAFELYTHAVYLRAIPGYTNARPEIDINYMHPDEILDAIPPDGQKPS